MSLSFFNSKKLTTPGLFPIRLQDDQLNWKMKLDYAAPIDKFLLCINDRPLEEMAYRSEIKLEGPQNIVGGKINLNDVYVHEGFA